MTQTQCSPNHTRGNKPQIVPIAGYVGSYVVYHGDGYLDEYGQPQRHPSAWMSWHTAQHAIDLHESDRA